MGLKSKFREFEFELRFSRDLIRNLRVKEFDLKHLFSAIPKAIFKIENFKYSARLEKIVSVK